MHQVEKTTLLAAMLAHVAGVAPGERLVIVEDTTEVLVPGAHLIRLQSRPPNLEGAGEVTLTTLVRQALRMRPDRLVVGEVRGAEVRELLSALNTGHDGGCGTIHANSSHDVVARFEALGLLAGLDAAAVRGQLASAVSVVIHVRREPGGGRVVDSVGVLERCGTEVEVRPAVDAAGRPQEGWSVLQRLCALPAGEPG